MTKKGGKMNNKEYVNTMAEYNDFINIYKELGDSIPKNIIDKIVRCRDNFDYCYNSNKEFRKRDRCKTRHCPICNRKMKGKKFFDIKEKTERFNGKYCILSLTVNGRNVENDVEKIRAEIKNNNEKFKKLKNKLFFKKVVKSFLKVIEIKFDEVTNDACPHLHIILFVIRGFYKHTNIRKLSEEIKFEWNKLEQSNLNVFLRGISTKNMNIEKISKTISYLTSSKKKRLTEIFGKNPEVLKVYLECTKNMRLYTWGTIK